MNQMPTRGRTDLYSCLLLVLLGVLFFSDSLFSAKMFYFRDILNFHYPLHKIMIDSYARGEFPLWNPFLYLGQPMLANPNYMALYPTNLFHLFSSFNYAFKLHLLIQPILGGVGLFFFQKRLGISAPASLGGSIVYQFSGTVLSYLNLFSIVQTVALLPWIGWAFLGGLQRGSSRRILLFGAILALQVITFEPILLQCCLLLLMALAVVHVLDSREYIVAIRRVLLVGCMGGIIALSLSAVQIFPTIELLSRSARGTGYGYETVSFASMHPADLLNTLVPSLFGNIYVVNSPTYWGELFHGARESYLVSYFVGAPSILLFLLSFFSLRRKLRGVLAGILLTSIVLALGKFTPVFGWLYQNVPPFRLGRYPSKYFLLGTLALAVLVAMGLEVLLDSGQDGRPRRRKIMAVSVIGLAFALVLAGIALYWHVFPQQHAVWLIGKIDPILIAGKDLTAIMSQMVRSIRDSAVYLSLSSALVFAAVIFSSSRLPALLLLVALIGALLPENLRLLPLVSEEVVNYIPEVNAYIKAIDHDQPFRAAPPTLLRPVGDLHLKLPNLSMGSLNVFYRKSGQAMFGLLNGIQYSLDRSLDQLNTRESEELWRGIVDSNEAAALAVLQKVNSPVLLSLDEMKDPSLRMLASFETDSNRNVRVYWLDDALPRAYFVSGLEWASSQEEARERFLRPNFSFANTIILEGSRVSGSGKAVSSAARILEYQNGRVVCEVKAGVAGYLVLLDSYYPGWRAFLNGKEVEVLRANYAFRAVSLPEGEHRVEFVYRPLSFTLGLGITGFALILGFVAMTFKRQNTSS